jgi:3'(2'), 5'-bisphosphate nucleotidase
MSQRELQPILDAVRLASTLCRRVQTSEAGAQSKSDASPVTIADYGAQALLCRAIAHHYPGEGVLAEEGVEAFEELVPAEERALVVGLVGELLGERVTERDFVRWLGHGREVRSARTWAIDPVDGTRGFVSGRAYAVCAGLLREGQPVGAVIGVPVSPLEAGGTLFFTEGGRAWAEPLAGGQARELRVSEREAPSEVRRVESVERGSHAPAFLASLWEALGLKGAPVESYDGMVKYGLVAAGAAELFVRGPRAEGKHPHMAWDHAAGTALVLAAGGRVTGLEGEPVDFTRGRELPNAGIIVSNVRLHARVLEAVRTLRPPA